MKYDVWGGTGGSVFISTNNGTSWTAVNNRFTNSFISEFAVSGTNLFLGTSGAGIFLSTNDGTNWNAVNTGLRINDVQAFVIGGSNLFMGTEGTGVWRRPLSEMTPVKEVFGTAIPKTFSLEQNYHNPFNPGTTIKFSLPKAAHITLSIFNAMGQEVSKLISKDMNAGVYTTEWKASGFASGVYYCRLITVDFIETKKLILVK